MKYIAVIIGKLKKGPLRDYETGFCSSQICGTYGSGEKDF
jgi:hypothetical protein